MLSVFAFTSSAEFCTTASPRADLYKKSEDGFACAELALDCGCKESACILLDAEKHSDLQVRERIER